MQLIITAKATKNKINEKELDKTVNKIVRIAYKLNGYKWIGYKCMKDRTTLILEK